MFMARSPSIGLNFFLWMQQSTHEDCSLLSGSLALEALLIAVHCKKRYINVNIQYNIQYNPLIASAVLEMTAQDLKTACRIKDVKCL